MKRSKKGFTLLEMLMVLIVVAILMALIIPNVSGQKQRIEKQARENMAQIIETQVETYTLVEKDTDVTLDDLTDKGYLTQKQSQEAQRLLNLSDSETLSVPIDIPE